MEIKDNHLKIGIIKEEKIPVDERVPFTPVQCRQIMDKFPCEIVVQSSDLRRIKDEEYIKEGIKVLHEMDDCDILMGVKEVPKDSLIPNKTYFFFSHTIKEQPYNWKLLRSVLDKQIRLIDYECLTGKDGLRLLGFGRYAGIVGTYNGFRMIGDKTGDFNIKTAFECVDQKDLFSQLGRIKTKPLKICITGNGRVASGAIEVLEAMAIRKVSVKEFLNHSFNESVYVQLGVTEYNRRKDGEAGDMMEFFKSPELYDSDFRKLLAHIDYYLACHFWDTHAPVLFTKKDMSEPTFNLKYIADISCDIEGPIPSTIRSSTIANPFYGIDKKTGNEVPLNTIDALAVMAVDNLPCELPVDASVDFGRQLMEKTIPSLFNGDKDGILKRASITKDGHLTEPYQYLSNYVQGK